MCENPFELNQKKNKFLMAFHLSIKSWAIYLLLSASHASWITGNKYFFFVS